MGKLSKLEERASQQQRQRWPRGKGKWVNSVNRKRGYLNNLGRGGQGEGEWVNLVNSVYWKTIKTKVTKGKVNG